MPRVSAIMPAFNAAPFLGRAIESVLTQSFTDLELIVVDDASTDETATILRSVEARYANRVKVLRQGTRTGPAGARNIALAASSGEYLVFTDADDIQHPHRVERSLAELMSPTAPAMVFVDCEMIDAQEDSLQREKGYPHAFCADTALLFQLERNHLWTSLCAMRRLPNLCFDETLPNSEDYEFFLRLLIDGQRLAVIREPLVQYRVHDSNLSADYAQAKDCARQILSRLDYDALARELRHRHSEPDVRLAVASALLACDRSREALEQLQYIASALETARAFKREFIAGVAHYQLGEWTQCRDCFLRAHEDNSDDAAVLNNLGVLTAVLDRDIALAMDYFKTAVSTRPGYNDAEWNLQRVGVSLDDLLFTSRPLRDSLIHTNTDRVPARETG